MNQIEKKKRQMEMISYMLGLIVLLLIGNILGENAVAYLAIAMECFLLFWTVTGSCLADVLGKLVRVRSSKGQYKNATKLRRNALVVEVFLGIIGSLLLFVLAKPLGERLFGLAYVVPMIQILAPVIFVRTLSSVLLGYFQGEGTELPTVISYGMRQVCVFGLSLIFVNLFKNYGEKVSALLRLENFSFMYSGMGVAVAIMLTECLILLFLLLVYRGSRRREKRGNEGMRTTDTFGGQMAVLYGNLFPAILTTFLGLLPLWLGILFFRKSISDIAGLLDYGIFYGRLLPILGLFIIPGCMLLLPSCHKMVGCLQREEQRFARGYFQSGLHMSMVYALFTAVFSAVLAPQIAGVLCKAYEIAATQMLRYGAVVIFFAVMMFFESEILSALGSKFILIGLQVLYNVVYAISLVCFLNGVKAGIMSLVYGAVVAGIVYTAAGLVLICMQLRFGINWLQSVAIPAGVASVTGLVLLLITKVMTPHLGNLLTIFLSLLIGNLVYWVGLMLLRNFREQDLSFIPGGKLIRMLGHFLRVY